MEFLYAMTLWSMCCVTCPTDFEVRTPPNANIVIVVWSSRDTLTVKQYPFKSSEQGILYASINTPREYNEITVRVCNIDGGCLIYSSATPSVPDECLKVATYDITMPEKGN